MSQTKKRGGAHLNRPSAGRKAGRGSTAFQGGQVPGHRGQTQTVTNFTMEHVLILNIGIINSF